MVEELHIRGFKAEQQVQLPIFYKGRKLKKHYVVDVFVEDEIIVELKRVKELHPVHEVQLVTYIKLANKKLGYLMNFNVTQMVKGVKRKVNNL